MRGVIVAKRLHRIDAAQRRVAGVEHEIHQLGIGQLHHHVQLGLALHERPRMRMERELDPGLGGSLPDLVQIPRQDFSVFEAQVLGADAPAEIDLQMLAAEMRDVTRARGVALDRLLDPARDRGTGRRCRSCTARDLQSSRSFLNTSGGCFRYCGMSSWKGSRPWYP